MNQTINENDLKGKRIAFVLPSPRLYKSNKGKKIDSYDFVARTLGSSGRIDYTNTERRHGATRTPSRADVGTRTDILFIGYVAEYRCRPLDIDHFIEQGVKLLVFRLYGNFKDIDFVKQCLEYRRIGINVTFMRNEMSKDDFDYMPLMGTRAADWMIDGQISELGIFGMDFFLSEGSTTDREKSSSTYWHKGYQREHAEMKPDPKYGIQVCNEQLQWFRENSVQGIIRPDKILQDTLLNPPSIEDNRWFNERLYRPEQMDFSNVREGLTYQPQAVVVGNGESVKKYEFGEEIDNFKEVVRFRQHSNHEKNPQNRMEQYRLHVGAKTTRMIYNTSEEVCKAFRSEYDPFTHYMFTFESWGRDRIMTDIKPHLTGKGIFLEGNTIKRAAKCKSEKGLSSGLIAVLYAIEMWGVVAIHGFDHVDGHKGESMHFFESHPEEEYHHHDLEEEAQIIDQLITAGRIRLLKDILEERYAEKREHKDQE